MNEKTLKILTIRVVAFKFLSQQVIKIQWTQELLGCIVTQWPDLFIEMYVSHYLWVDALIITTYF